MKEKWREFFWPIHRHELSRVLPMALMMSCFLFNYTIMRDLKDTLILSTAGAEAIPFLKFWGTLPCSILFVLIYAKASNIFQPKALYTVTLLPFFGFFTLFGFVLYPFREFLHPTHSGEAIHHFLSGILPASGQQLATSLTAVVQNWSYALFYIMSELWGSMGVSLLFWQFANSITSTEEAKRFYPRFTQLGNISLIFSGLCVVYFSNLRNTLPPGVDSWGITLKWLMTLVGLSCVVLLATYFWIHRKTPQQIDGQKPKEKLKLSLKESFLFLTKSKYLGLIAILLIAYGISINLIEIVFKSQLKLYYPSEGEMSAFYGKLSMSIGATTFLLVVCSSYILNKLSWKVAALVTPLFVLLTGGLFFSAVFFNEPIGRILSISPLFFAVLMGAIQNSTAKGMKYALFDPTKEMAYIPLDNESKIKGKAAIDVIGGRLGKSGGGLYLQFLLLFGSIMDNLAIIYVSVVVIVAAWAFSVLRLNRLYTAKTQEGESLSVT